MESLRSLPRRLGRHHREPADRRAFPFLHLEVVVGELGDERGEDGLEGEGAVELGVVHVLADRREDVEEAVAEGCKLPREVRERGLERGDAAGLVTAVDDDWAAAGGRREE